MRSSMCHRGTCRAHDLSYRLAPRTPSHWPREGLPSRCSHGYFQLPQRAHHWRVPGWRSWWARPEGCWMNCCQGTDSHHSPSPSGQPRSHHGYLAIDPAEEREPRLADRVSRANQSIHSGRLFPDPNSIVAFGSHRSTRWSSTINIPPRLAFTWPDPWTYWSYAVAFYVLLHRYMTWVSWCIPPFTQAH